MADVITLGSGKLYVAEYDGELPDVETIRAEANRLGYIKGGATITYTPTYYTATDDLGFSKKSVLTEEEVKLTSGVMTWDANTLKRLSDTGRVTEDSAKGTRTIRIGGAANASNTNYAILFYHEDPADGDKWVEMVGRNQAGFSLAFAKDSETVVDAEFVAEPCDGEGTLLVFGEQFAAPQGA